MTAAAALGQSGGETLNVAGGRIHVTIAGQALAPARARLRSWVERSATVVARYYGQFPVEDTYVYVTAREGNDVGHGVTFREDVGIINISVGSDVTDSELRDDWVLVHEMIHLALPNIRRQHTWLAEGLSTYVGSVARVQAGHRGEADAWTEFVGAIPLGLPHPGEGGLDQTPTWARTYWGGALFCLLADVDIRERTEGRVGLQDALQALARAGRADASVWSIDRIIHVADEATGTTVLADLYAAMKDTPVSPDLDALWVSLGVSRRNATVHLTVDAPRAHIRREIMSPRANAEPR